MITPPDHLQHISDRDLIDEIHNQRSVMNDCIELAQHKAGAIHSDHRHQCNGLYFAQLRQQQLTEELMRRFRETSDNYNTQNN